MWIVKWFAGHTDGRVYFQRYDAARREAFWAREQKNATRYATKGDAYAVSSMWSSKSARPVRLVPRKKS